MIRFAIHDREGTINLLDKEKAYHLMREGHLGQSDLFGSRRIDPIGESIGTADDKNQSFVGRMHFLFEVNRKLRRGELLSFLIKRSEERRVGKEC